VIPDPSEAGERGRRLSGVGNDWRLECREFGPQQTLMGFVLLASEVAYEVQILRLRELTFDRSTPCAAVVAVSRRLRF
jgi:hypothetical protein